MAQRKALTKPEALRIFRTHGYVRIDDAHAAYLEEEIDAVYKRIDAWSAAAAKANAAKANAAKAG